ncbi:hypothetical protein BgiMline_026908, partial [Biomphalaria glabrata]
MTGTDFRTPRTGRGIRFIVAQNLRSVGCFLSSRVLHGAFLNTSLTARVLRMLGEAVLC